MRGGWERAGRGDLAALGAFLRARGAERAGLAGPLLREGRLRLPNPLRGGVWIRRPGAEGEDAGAAARPGGQGLSAALLVTPGGAVHPRWGLPVSATASGGGAGAAAPRADTGRTAADRLDAELGPLLADRGLYPSSAIGPARDVARFEAALGLAPLVAVRYRLMELSGAFPAGARPEVLGARRGLTAGGAGATGAARALAEASVRPARPSDLEALEPLQAGYEIEEVVTPIHSFDAAGSRAGLARSLADQLVVLAELDGRVVGKAQTNARSFSLDQIGGVYVEPGFRGRGLGRLLMEGLLSLVAAAGKGAVLFVKEDNRPARALYLGLGFRDLGPFSADYYLA